jgi:hypothetical protein
VPVGGEGVFGGVPEAVRVGMDESAPPDAVGVETGCETSAGLLELSLLALANIHATKAMSAIVPTAIARPCFRCCARRTSDLRIRGLPMGKTDTNLLDILPRAAE